MATKIDDFIKRVESTAEEDFFTQRTFYHLSSSMFHEMRELLKEQEPKKPKAIKPICKIIFDVPYYFCGDCKAMLNMYSTKAKFCSQCGQAVKWEYVIK